MSSTFLFFYFSVLTSFLSFLYFNYIIIILSCQEKFYLIFNELLFFFFFLIIPFLWCGVKHFFLYFFNHSSMYKKYSLLFIFTSTLPFFYSLIIANKSAFVKWIKSLKLYKFRDKILCNFFVSFT